MRGLTKWTDPTWDPFAELAAVSEAFDRAFADLGFPAGVAGERGLLEMGVAPDLRVAAEGDGYHVAMDLPGLPKDSLEVKCAGDSVTVEGEWPEPAVGEGTMAWRQERPRGRFVRSFSLGEPLEASSATAKLEDGVLHLRLKKTPEAKGRTIKVKS